MSLLKRDILSDMSVVASATGTAYNNSVVLFAPVIKMDELGIDITDNLLEILSPIAIAGGYTVSNPYKNTVEITSIVAEPLDKRELTFRLSNRILTVTPVSISQADQFTFTDNSISFVEMSIKTQWDIEHDPSYTGGVWQLQITASGSGTYDIANVLPNGYLELDDPLETLPKSNVSGVTYLILDDSGNVIASSSTGKLRIKRRAKLDLSAATGIADIRNYVKPGYYLVLNGNQYRITGFVPGGSHQIYIDGYQDGNASGLTIEVLQRLVESIGNLDYMGLRLQTLTDHEAGLPILDGVNAVSENDMVESDELRGNYLVVIGTSYFAISNIDGTTITLAGPHTEWGRLSAGGTSVSYSIYRYVRQPFTVSERESPYTMGHEFDFYDRRGKEIVIQQVETASSMLMVHALNHINQGKTTDVAGLEEKISFRVEYLENHGK